MPSDETGTTAEFQQGFVVEFPTPRRREEKCEVEISSR
jgi:hypothetical protein